MWGGIRSAACVGLGVLVFTVGCGGGGGGGGALLAPPAVDFSIVFSPGSVNLPQGTTSGAVSVSITSENGFSGSVQVSLSGVPAGVTCNPSGTFTVDAGQSAAVLFGADATAGTGQFSVTAQASSGSLGHSASLELQVEAGALLNLPRTTYVRTDAVGALDSPSGEPHRRHMIYDPAGQRFFVANRAMNRVDVVSGTNPALAMSIDAPGASSVDLSADGSTLWVGTALEQILEVDLRSLQVKARHAVGALTPIPGSSFSRPTEVVALASGKFLVRLRQPDASESLLALWEPGSDTLTDLTAVAPAIFQAGLGVLARTGDQTRVLIAANDASGTVAELDSTGRLLAGPVAFGAGSISNVAANADGSRFAVVLSAGSMPQIILLDANLNPAGAYGANGFTGLVFSRDGQTLFAGERVGSASVVTVLSAADLSKLGQIPDVAVQGVPSTIEDVDGSQFIGAMGNRGVSFLDAAAASQLALPAGAPSFVAAPVAQPAEGPNAGGTTVSVAGTNFAGSPELRFGTLAPVGANAVSASQIQATAPASAASGAVNLTAYFSNGWVALAPAAFSYGPKIEQVLPNAGSPGGGDSITIIGEGFGSSAGSVTVTIGGQSATVQKVEALPAFAGAMSLDSTYPFSLERITVTTPAGTPGKADIAVKTPSGNASAAKSFQFLNTSQAFGTPGLHKFILYDQTRQQVYVSDTTQIEVFHLQTQGFGAPLSPYPGGPPPDAALRGLTLTPDHSQLIVADFGAQSIYLINPDQGADTSVQVPVGGVAGFLNSGPARVTATSASTVFVGLSGEGGAAGACSGCLGELNLTAGTPTYEPAPQPEVTSLTGAPFLQADASGDTVYLAFGNATGGPVGYWNAAAPNVFTVSATKNTSSDLTTAADGNLFAVRSSNTTEIRSSSLSLVAAPAAAALETISGRVAVPGVTLHPSGALIYEPFLDGPAPLEPPARGIHGGIDIRDAHNGRLRLRVYLPEPFAMLSTDTDGLHGGFLTTDENGKRLFAATTSGLTVMELASVPLGIGALTPASGAATGGSSVTLRGSGFQAATKVTLGGKAVSAAFKDMNTLTFTTPALNAGAQQLAVTNPDGETAWLDAAFVAE